MQGASVIEAVEVRRAKADHCWEIHDAGTVAAEATTGGETAAWIASVVIVADVEVRSGATALVVLESVVAVAKGPRKTRDG
jgi:hypothetical protein